MKRFKILSILLTLVMALCLAIAACGERDKEAKDGTGNSAGGVLVVYYSATNNTEKIAGYIADITGATQFELVPADPYTQSDLNYSDSQSRVSKEHGDESLRNVELVDATPDGWANYGTVFIGYPIWWGTASWVVNGFITANDFTGKTVVPFCTSASSGIGQSDKLLKEMAGTGNWKDGKRFSSSASKDDVEEWIESLDITFGNNAAATETLNFELNAAADGYIVTRDEGQTAFRIANLTALTIPASVTSIDKYAIQNSAITQIIFEGTAAEWDSVQKARYWNMDKTEIAVTLAYPEGNQADAL